MKLSSDTLFHFSSFENILSILKGGHFQAKYAREIYKIRQYTSQNYVPMCCFCDIPLTQTEDHIKDYGGNAIGMTKDWGISHGLNPVFYFVPNSLTVTIEILSSPEKYNQEFVGAFLHLLSFIKLHEGKNPKNNSNKKLYDEREWRFVPYFYRTAPNGLKQVYIKDDFKESYNNDILEYPDAKLTINSKDLKYIIAENETSKKQLCDFLENSELYHEDYRLQSIRIFTIDEIYKDF
jgi:hypothetical protein